MNSGNVVTFSVENYVDDVSDIMRGSRLRNFPVVDKEGHLCGVISRRHLLDSVGKRVILIDHNERSQSVKGLEQAAIIEIIDHHRVADIQTEYPLYIRSEPVGCSSTIIYKIYRESGIEIPENIAGLMLSAILSDTLMFSSPTCTSVDKAAAEELSKIAQVDLKEYGREMFKAGTELDELSAEEILSSDRKRFTFGNTAAYISQINTLDFASLSGRMDEIVEHMEKFYESGDITLAILMITDIVAGGSEIIAVGKDKELLNSAFGMKREDFHIFLPGVVSRKQQVVPKLAHVATTGII